MFLVGARIEISVDVLKPVAKENAILLARISRGLHHLTEYRNPTIHLLEPHALYVSGFACLSVIYECVRLPYHYIYSINTT